MRDRGRGFKDQARAGEVGGGLNDQHEVGLALGEAGLAYRVSYKHVPLLWP